MKKSRSLVIVTTLVTLLLSLTHTINSSLLECTFKSNRWSIYDIDRQIMNQTEMIRYCEVANKEIFVNFVRVEGCASGNENLAQVTGFVFTHGTMNYFPHGIDKIFRSLTAIQVEEAKLREIHVEDLAGFKKLRILYLNSNELRVIEADLFKFNEELEYIRLDFNQISHFDPQVFSHLVNLKFLTLKENACKVGNAVGGDEVRTLIKSIEDEKCINYEDLSGVSNGQERILRILNSVEEPPSDEGNSQNSKITELEAKIKEITAENKNFEAKIKEISTENQNLILKVNELNLTECNTDDLESSLRTCQSNLEVKSQEISRLQKVIEQLENTPSTSNKIPWKDILIPSVIGLLTLVTLIVGIILIIIKINFIIQKLKDQFQTTRRPLNVPNDFWHHEE